LNSEVRTQKTGDKKQNEKRPVSVCRVIGRRLWRKKAKSKKGKTKIAIKLIHSCSYNFELGTLIDGFI
jgi:hypothetical protein